MKISMTRRSVAFLVATAALAALAGCATSGNFRAEAFGANKTYAVVSLVSDDKVQCGQPTGNPCNMGVVGLVNTLATANAAYREDAAPTLELVAPALLQSLKGVPGLKLASDVRTLSAYKATKADDEPPGFMGSRLMVAKGYKYFPDSRLGKIASELNVDGVIVLRMNFTAIRSGFPVMGFGGGHVAETIVHVTAVDRQGKVVWSDRARGSSDASAGSVAGGVDFPKLRPLFVESTNKAMKRLAENAGKSGGT
ncbi:MAG TPA: hypothetical protein VF522_13390 [Ramlibacter sp.]|uniref:hypothetical protein n=1 Tax=Ramlibacter sp. TaxID=1917967 RepID=UPI002ED6A631